jgi:predicted ribosome-associated RNA-binding protein Tma20
MTTRFRLRYDYIDQSNDDKLPEAVVKEMLRGSNADNMHHCDDLALRTEWLQEENCFFVELDEITLYHTSVCVMGLQAHYRCEYDDSKVLVKQGAKHFFVKGYFSFHCGLNSINEIIRLKVTRKDSIITVRPERNGVKGKAVTVSNLLPTQSLSI